MAKPISAMTDREMLAELLQEKRRNDRARNIQYMIAGALLVIAAVLLYRFLPPVIHYFQRLNDTIDTIQSGVDQVQSVTDGIKETLGSVWDKLANLFR